MIEPTGDGRVVSSQRRSQTPAPKPRRSSGPSVALRCECRGVTRARLRVLEVRDFHRLLEDHPKLSAAIVEEAARRVAISEPREA